MPSRAITAAFRERAETWAGLGSKNVKITDSGSDVGIPAGVHPGESKQKGSPNHLAIMLGCERTGSCV